MHMHELTTISKHDKGTGGIPRQHSYVYSRQLSQVLSSQSHRCWDAVYCI